MSVSDISPVTATCPQGHPWTTSQKRCHVCDVANPGYAFEQDKPVVENVTIISLPQTTPTPPLVQASRGAYTQLAPAAASTTRIDVEANIKRLAEELCSFRKEHGAEGKIIGVFGSPKSGKSFLNARLEWIVNAKRDGTTGLSGYRVIRSTQSNTATWAEFELIGPTRGRQHFLVVDLPGEEFNRATESTGIEVEQYNEVLKVADGLILYISGETVDERDKFQGDEFQACLPPESNYKRFLDLAHARRNQGAGTLCNMPVFIALSKADRIASMGTGPEALRKLSAQDAWQYLSVKSPALRELLLQKFSSFCCGFVASHVGAQSRIGLSFESMENGEALLPLAPSIANALTDAPMADFFLACLDGQLQGGGVVDSLPSPEIMALHGLTPELFFLQASLVTDSAQPYLDTVNRLNGLVRTVPVPIAADGLPSYGVRSMMERLTDLIQESAWGFHRRDEDSYARVRAESEESTFGRVQLSVAAYLARSMKGYSKLGNRIMRILRMTPETSVTRVVIVGGVACLLPLLALIYWKAESTVNDRREAARQLIKGVKPLPPEFALDAAKIWSLDKGRLEEISRKFPATLPVLGLHDDHLVRAPDFASALKANEAGQTFHALWPDTSKLTGRRALALFLGMDCANARTCKLSASAGTLEIAPLDTRVDGARVSNYAGALSAYLRKADVKDIKYFLKLFEDGRRSSLGDRIETAEAPSKQILLPQLVSKLMLAHTEFRNSVYKSTGGDIRTNVDWRSTYQRYGKALDEALDEYQRQGKSLAGKKNRLADNLWLELRAVGVDSNVLNAHILATSLASSENYEDLVKDVQRRFERYGKSLDADKVFDIDSFGTQYPELLCLYQHMRRVAGSTSQASYGKACEATSGSVDNPFGVERRLVDANFWAGDRSDTDIAYERYAPLVRDAAEKASKTEQDQKTRDSLSALRQLKDPAPAWRLLLEFPFLIALAVAAALAAFFSALAVWIWRWTMSAHRLVSPFTQDKQ